METNNLSLIESFIRYCGIIPSICFNSFFLLEGFSDFIAPTCFSVWFSKVFPKGKYANLACSTIGLWLKDNISSPVRYSHLSIFQDAKANIFAASLLILYYSFHISSLILTSVATISFCFLSKKILWNVKDCLMKE